MRTEAREPIITDFGTFLQALRLEKGIPVKSIADALHLSPQTIRNIENNRNKTPHPNRLKVWLGVLGCSDKYDEALTFLRRVKRRRTVEYILRSEATEHIDRLLDAYETGSLDDLDIDLLKCIAIREYRTPDSRPPAKERKPKTVPDIAYTEEKKTKGVKRDEKSPPKKKQISKTKVKDH